ncbi:Oligopeptide transporter 2, partial [Candida parapsilosis]
GLNVLVELIVGYAIPGNGLALAFIKALGYNIDGQANNFVNDLKQGHYAKVPPRAMFRTQLLSVFVTAFIQLGILNYQITGIKDYCDPYNKQKFFCYGTNTFYNASVLWGVIGPKRVFGGLYPILRYCFLIGFLAGLVCVAIKRLAPRRYTKYFEPTVFLGAFTSWAPGNLSYSTGGVYLGYAMMHHVKRKYEAWWQKYSYLLGSGIQAGIAFSSIIIYFAVQYHEKDVNWWGNSVGTSGLDYQMRVSGSRLDIADAPDGYFGPRKGHYP